MVQVLGSSKEPYALLLEIGSSFGCVSGVCWSFHWTELGFKLDEGGYHSLDTRRMDNSEFKRYFSSSYE